MLWMFQVSSAIKGSLEYPEIAGILLDPCPLIKYLSIKCKAKWLHNLMFI